MALTMSIAFDLRTNCSRLYVEAQLQAARAFNTAHCQGTQYIYQCYYRINQGARYIYHCVVNLQCHDDNKQFCHLKPWPEQQA
jgi:hypothetical protein